MNKPYLVTWEQRKNKSLIFFHTVTVASSKAAARKRVENLWYAENKSHMFNVVCIRPEDHDKLAQYHASMDSVENSHNANLYYRNGIYRRPWHWCDPRLTGDNESDTI